MALASDAVNWELDAQGFCYVFDGPDEILSRPQLGKGADRAPLFEHTFKQVTLEGDWAQFGVYQGRTVRDFILPALPDTAWLWLFDSFKGLPTDWRKGMSVEPKGKYACMPPRFGSRRVKVVEGLFADTVNVARGNTFAFIDIDCDLYQSTRDVLFGVNDSIVPGTIIRFDEVFSYPLWREGEYKAVQEWLDECGREIEWLARGGIYWATCRVIR